MKGCLITLGVIALLVICCGGLALAIYGGVDLLVSDSPVTYVPPAENPAPADTGGCQVEQIGPWPPSTDNYGHDIEITAPAESYMLVSAYWPQGAPTYGISEVIFTLNSGDSIELFDAAGTAWIYTGCTTAEANAHASQYNETRPGYTDNWFGWTTVQKVIDLGLGAWRR